jgi:hypothetical protein
VQCSFNFTSSGLWSIRADYALSGKTTTTTTTTTPSNQIFAVTVLRVGS